MAETGAFPLRDKGRQVQRIAFHMRGARTEARFLAASLPARAKCPLGFIQHHIGLVYELIGGLIG